jgi:hypothetical protein
MPALVIGGTTIQAFRESVPRILEEVGADRSRMVNAAMRQLEGVRKNSWSFHSKLLTYTELTTVLLPALQAAPPIACSGDILGAAYNCFIQVESIDSVPVKGLIRHRARFTLFEA